MSVLIVEDDPALAGLLRTLMVRERLAVEVVTRGDVACRAIENGNYRAVVLDLMLPGMNGVDLMRRIATVRPEMLRRTIVLTAVSHSKLEHFEFRSDICSLIRKPFDVPDLIRIVRECIAANTPRRFEEIAQLTRWLAAQAVRCGAYTALIATRFGRDLMLNATFGYGDGFVEGYFPLPLDGRYPICATVRTGNATWLRSVDLRPAEFPELLPIWTSDAQEALATVPLVAAESPFGAVGLTFRRRQEFGDEQRRMLFEIADECAAALARTNLPE